MFICSRMWTIIHSQSNVFSLCRWCMSLQPFLISCCWSFFFEESRCQELLMELSSICTLISLVCQTLRYEQFHSFNGFHTQLSFLMVQGMMRFNWISIACCFRAKRGTVFSASRFIVSAVNSIFAASLTCIWERNMRQLHFYFHIQIISTTFVVHFTGFVMRSVSKRVTFTPK